MALAQEDLPGRVGRVADVGGELFLAPQDQPDAWAPIGLNYPVTSGDNLWVGNDGRAEIDFGGRQFRVAGDTNLHVSRLDDRQFALFVAQGRVSVRVRVLEPGETARVDTPNAQVVLTRPGLYRVDVSNDREHTRVVVREGEANVQTAGALQQVLPGQTADVDGADPQYATVHNGVGIDGFDSWVASRDRYYRARRHGDYVSPQMVGAADLDQYGTWTQNAEYGAVWYPTDVATDWAPYRNGYWTDVGAWGPTWVDYCALGLRAVPLRPLGVRRGRWGWAPGTYVARPLWAPALVGWTGGAGWSMSATVGAPVYGWVPLGWGEPYRPWWGRCSNGCWDRYNRPYAVNVAVWRPNSPPPTSYRNWNAPSGITAVSGSAFYTRQPVQQNLVRVSREQWRPRPCCRARRRARRASRAAFQRPASAPPPASTFHPTTARPTRTQAAAQHAARDDDPAAPYSARRTPTCRRRRARRAARSLRLRCSARQPARAFVCAADVAGTTSGVAQPPSRVAQPQTPQPQPYAQPPHASRSRNRCRRRRRRGRWRDSPAGGGRRRCSNRARVQAQQPAPTPQASQPRPPPQAAPHTCAASGTAGAARTRFG